MLAQNIRYRSAVYANVYGSSFGAKREQATAFYTRIADEAFPNLHFQFTPATESESPKVTMTETQGTRQDVIVVDIEPRLGLRLVIEQKWMDSFAIACRKADIVERAFQEVIGNTLPNCEIQIAEVRIRAQVPVAEGTGLKYLADRIMGTRSGELSELGNLSFWGIRCEIQPADITNASALDTPCREVRIEPLRDDQRSIYIEVVSNWGRSGMRVSSDRPGQVELVPGPLTAQEPIPPPSAYFEEVKDYIESMLCPFLEKKA